MMSLARGERKAARLVSNLDIDDLYDRLDNLRAYAQELSSGLGRNAGRHFGRAREYASDAAQEAEETMKDNLAASLIFAVGLGVVVGYLIRRSSD